MRIELMGNVGLIGWRAFFLEEQKRFMVIFGYAAIACEQIDRCEGSVDNAVLLCDH